MDKTHFKRLFSPEKFRVTISLQHIQKLIPVIFKRQGQYSNYKEVSSTKHPQYVFSRRICWVPCKIELEVQPASKDSSLFTLRCNLPKTFFITLWSSIIVLSLCLYYYFFYDQFLTTFVLMSKEGIAAWRIGAYFSGVACLTFLWVFLLSFPARISRGFGFIVQDICIRVSNEANTNCEIIQRKVSPYESQFHTLYFALLFVLGAVLQADPIENNTLTLLLALGIIVATVLLLTIASLLSDKSLLTWLIPSVLSFGASLSIMFCLITPFIAMGTPDLHKIAISHSTEYFHLSVFLFFLIICLPTLMATLGFLLSAPNRQELSQLSILRYYYPLPKDVNKTHKNITRVSLLLFIPVALLTIPIYIFYLSLIERCMFGSSHLSNPILNYLDHQIRTITNYLFYNNGISTEQPQLLYKVLLFSFCIPFLLYFVLLGYAGLKKLYRLLSVPRDPTLEKIADDICKCTEIRIRPPRISFSKDYSEKSLTFTYTPFLPWCSPRIMLSDSIAYWYHKGEINKNQLALLLAHEMGHLKNDALRLKLLSTSSALCFMGKGYFSVMLDTQNSEKKADKVVANYMRVKKIDINVFEDLLKKLRVIQDAKQEKVSKLKALYNFYFSNSLYSYFHLADEERIEHLRDLLKESP